MCRRLRQGDLYPLNEGSPVWAFALWTQRLLYVGLYVFVGAVAASGAVDRSNCCSTPELVLSWMSVPPASGAFWLILMAYARRTR